MTTNPYDELEGVDELPEPPRQEIPAADRELLALAARALGAEFEEVDGEGYGNLHFADGAIMHAWNALLFSGDALELAVRLQLQIRPNGYDTMACGRSSLWTGSVSETHHDEPMNATRRAIVRAAAEIGRAARA